MKANCGLCGKEDDWTNIVKPVKSTEFLCADCKDEYMKAIVPIEKHSMTGFVARGLHTRKARNWRAKFGDIYAGEYI